MSEYKRAAFRSDVSVLPIDSMGSDDSIIRAMLVSTQGADAIDATATAGRIKFLMANRHGSPFEHNACTFYVQAPIFVFREFHRHRIGWCLAGDTEVWCETISPGCGRTLRKRPIEELYRNWHEGVTDSMGRTRLLASCRNFTVRTLDETTGRFILSRVVDIYKNGEKPVLRMTTERGESIRATADHAFWTPEGWAKLGDLQVGDLVGRNSKVAISAGRQVPPALRAGIGVWTSMQRQSLIKPIDQCYACEEIFAFDDLVLDHVVPVATDLKLALDVENLAPMCEPCHRLKTNTEQVLADRGQTAGVGWTRIVSVEPDGVTETYDLELEGPNRGFVANGVVVHNSYNEESGRYKEMDGVFYVPAPERNIVQTGKPGAYTYVPGTPEQYDMLVAGMKDDCAILYESYQERLANGIAKEVARMTLPLNLFTSMFTTANARSIMAFLSLRKTWPEYVAKFPSFPMREIEMVAEQIDALFAEVFPLTRQAFVEHGCVAP